MKNYKINTDGNSTLITYPEFNALLSSGGYYRYTTEDEDTLYPYSEDNMKYHILLDNGKEKAFDKPVFVSLVDKEKDRKKLFEEHGQVYHPKFVHYEAGGYHVLMPPTERNSVIAKNGVEPESITPTEIHRRDRCIDEQGRVCRYIRDKDGKRIQNADGKDIGSKCSECPRNGWIGGNRINCCLCHSCKSDCTRCPNLKESKSNLSADAFEESGINLPDSKDYTKIAEDKLLLDALFSALNDDTAEDLVKEVHYGERDIMNIARELQQNEPDTQLKTIHQRLLRQYKRAMAQLKDHL